MGDEEYIDDPVVAKIRAAAEAALQQRRFKHGRKSYKTDRILAVKDSILALRDAGASWPDIQRLFEEEAGFKVTPETMKHALSLDQDPKHPGDDRRGSQKQIPASTPKRQPKPARDSASDLPPKRAPRSRGGSSANRPLDNSRSDWPIGGRNGGPKNNDELSAKTTVELTVASEDDQPHDSPQELVAVQNTNGPETQGLKPFGIKDRKF